MCPGSSLLVCEDIGDVPALFLVLAGQCLRQRRFPGARRTNQEHLSQTWDVQRFIPFQYFRLEDDALTGDTLDKPLGEDDMIERRFAYFFLNGKAPIEW